MREVALVQMPLLRAECLSRPVGVAFREELPRLPVSGRLPDPVSFMSPSLLLSKCGVGPVLLGVHSEPILTLVEEFVRPRLAATLCEPFLGGSVPCSRHLKFMQ